MKYWWQASFNSPAAEQRARNLSGGGGKCSVDVSSALSPLLCQGGGPQGHLLPNPHFLWRFLTEAPSRHGPIKISGDCSPGLDGHRSVLLNRLGKKSWVFHVKTLNRYKRNHTMCVHVAQGHTEMFFSFWFVCFSPSEHCLNYWDAAVTFFLLNWDPKGKTLLINFWGEKNRWDGYSWGRHLSP